MSKFFDELQLFRSFLKERILLYGGYLLLCLIFLCTFYLWEIPLEPFFDGAAFTFVCLVLVSIGRFFHYRRVHRELLRMKKNPNFHSSQLSLLPKGSRSLLEADYRDLFLTAVAQKEKVEVTSEELNNQLIDYYSMWSHQIKTPLAALDLLVQAQPEPSSTMKAELFKIEEYLNMMLQYLRMNHVNNDLVIKTLDLDHLIHLTVKKYASFFIQKNLTITIASNLKKVISDEKWFTFILEQILFNAIKYTPNQGEIRIYFEGESLVIEDTGIGILAEDLPRVFEQGYTGFNGREHQKATGLGLYMSEQIAQKIGLVLTIESEIGNGTKVFIRFPQEQFQVE
ncbi:sensor histidine kinase [Enterococcus sp. AZ192]|uniref:sensor histidine kinase n=1 Tax=unclassified Enterococcus TaxID=2608891 RepID=UPI003D2899A0